MIKKKIFGIGLALVAVAGIITSGVVWADGLHKTHVGPVKLDGVTIEAWGIDGNTPEIGQSWVNPITWSSVESSEAESSGATPSEEMPPVAAAVENGPVTQMLVNNDGTVDKSQDDSGCVCSFVIDENEPPEQDPSVYSIDSATGAVKYGYKMKVKFLDCPCALNNGFAFAIPPFGTNATP